MAGMRVDRTRKVPMPKPKMNPDEIDIDLPIVSRLIGKQFPQWADLPITAVRSAGTDNAIYRLGDDMAVRLKPSATARAPPASISPTQAEPGTNAPGSTTPSNRRAHTGHGTLNQCGNGRDGRPGGGT